MGSEGWLAPHIAKTGAIVRQVETYIALSSTNKCFLSHFQEDGTKGIHTDFSLEPQEEAERQKLNPSHEGRTQCVWCLFPISDGKRI